MMICANRKRQKRIEFIREKRKSLRAIKEEQAHEKRMIEVFLRRLEEAHDQSEFDSLQESMSFFIYRSDTPLYYLNKISDIKIAKLKKEWRKWEWYECV